MEEIKSIYTLVYCECLKNNAINQSIQLCTFYTCIFIDIPWCAMYYQCYLISEFNSTTSINNIFRMLLIFNYYWTYYIPIIPVFQNFLIFFYFHKYWMKESIRSKFFFHWWNILQLFVECWMLNYLFGLYNYD